MVETPPVVLTVAGFDPSSGAGVTADIKTIAAHGCYGVACITALTVQSTTGVRKVVPSEAGLVRETLEVLTADAQPSAVRIGMLGSGGVVKAVVEFLEAARPKLTNVVLDPILRSSSGADLVDQAGARWLRDKLMPICDVVTPNTQEASALTGIEVGDEDGMRLAASRLHEAGAKAVVITGGDLDQAVDLLSFTSKKGVQQEIFRAPRQISKATHGTGCAFATAVACQLALDRGLAEATLLAKVYVLAAMTAAYPIGQGTGPLNHLYRMNESKRVLPASERVEKIHE